MVKNSILGVQRNMFHQNIAFEKVGLFPISDLHQNFSKSLAEFFRPVSENYIVHVQANILKKKFYLFFDKNLLFSFSDFDRGTFELSDKLWCRFGQNCILCIRRNDLMKTSFFQKIRNVLPPNEIERKIY